MQVGRYSSWGQCLNVMSDLERESSNDLDLAADLSLDADHHLLPLSAAQTAAPAPTHPVMSTARSLRLPKVSDVSKAGATCIPACKDGCRR